MARDTECMDGNCLEALAELRDLQLQILCDGDRVRTSRRTYILNPTGKTRVYLHLKSEHFSPLFPLREPTNWIENPDTSGSKVKILFP